MGNNECKFSERFNKKYEFIQFHKDTSLGPIKIYRKKQPFYDYLMTVQRIIHDQQLQKYERQLSVIQRSFKSQEGSMFLRLYSHEILKNGIKDCNKRSRIRLYVQYFNYSLKDLIQHKNQQKHKFSMDEIMYVLENILKTYYFYQSISAYNISFQSLAIFLTPQGQIRFNPLKIFNDEQQQEGTCNQLNCIPTKFKKSFKLKDKLILYQIKKILSEMTELCNPVTVDDRNIFTLKRQINSCQKIIDIQRHVYKPSIYKLQFNSAKKGNIYQQSQQQTTKIYKNSPVISNSDFSKASHSSKISVKNVIKELRKQQNMNLRPISKQPFYPTQSNYQYL